MPDVFKLDERGRVSALEGKTLEFKRDLSSPTKPLRTIVAFANSAGGLLVVGVDARLHDSIEVSVEHLVEVVRLVPDSVVRDPILGEVVRADALGTVDRAYLRTAG